MTNTNPIAAALANVPRDVLEQAREFADLAEASPEAMRRLRAELDAMAPAPVASVRPVRTPAIPSRFVHVTGKDYEPRTPSQREAKEAVARWVASVKAGEAPRLALIGPPGVGKSHLAYAATRALLASGRTVYVRPWYHLADELRYGGPSPFDEHDVGEARAPKLEPWQVRALLFEQRIVVLDEVRPTASTELDESELTKFLARAYDADIAVLLTTNVSPLAAVTGQAAASRCTQVTIEGPDHRQAPAVPTPGGV